MHNIIIIYIYILYNYSSASSKSHGQFVVRIYMYSLLCIASLSLLLCFLVWARLNHTLFHFIQFITFHAQLLYIHYYRKHSTYLPFHIHNTSITVLYYMSVCMLFLSAPVYTILYIYIYNLYV